MSDGPVERCYYMIGRNIRDARKERGYSQDDLATLMHWTRNSIARIETGQQRFMLHTLASIAYHLRVTPMRLMKGTWG